MSKKDLKSFVANVDKATETPTGGVPQVMEDTGIVEASAARRLFIETSGNILSYPKGKVQGKTTICRAPLPRKAVSRSAPDYNVQFCGSRIKVSSKFKPKLLASPFCIGTNK